MPTLRNAPRHNYYHYNNNKIRICFCLSTLMIITSIHTGPIAFETPGSLRPTNAGLSRSLPTLSTVSMMNPKPINTYSRDFRCHPEGECCLHMGHFCSAGRSAPSAGYVMILHFSFFPVFFLYYLFNITIIGIHYSL